MGSQSVLDIVRHRLAARTDSEHGQALVRLAIVLIVATYFLSDYFGARVEPVALQRARVLIAISLGWSITMFGVILWRPQESVIRRFVGMFHDVTAISLSMYFGEGAGAAIAVVYLWITVGNGFRYGVRYLYACAAASMTGFGLVLLASEFWRGQVLLSLNILLVMLVVPPYVGSLLRSLHTARDALQRQASTDSLTGLLSRREMEAAVDAAFRTKSTDYLLIYCDLDRFKQVNDVAGHAAGDKLLTDIGDIIRRSVRADDLSARMGGDEFCVLLQDCSLERGRTIAENIRNTTNGYRLAWGTEYFSVGMSIGVAPSNAVNDAESLFRLADAACYAAKNAGRDRVHVVDPRTDLLNTQKIRQLFDLSDDRRGGAGANRDLAQKK